MDFVATYEFDMGSWGSMNFNNVLSYVDHVGYPGVEQCT